jgi:hypothetical protein
VLSTGHLENKRLTVHYANMHGSDAPMERQMAAAGAARLLNGALVRKASLL